MTVFDRLETPACSCDDGHGALPPVPVALEAALSCVTALRPARSVPLSRALGRVLAADVRAAVAMPRFDTSGMDGYALRHSDLVGGGTLPLDGIAAAGGRPARLRRGTAMRIYTGAPVPDGADTVVMQEAVRATPGGIDVCVAPLPGANIRRHGEDLTRGALVVPAGTCLGPRDIAACAAAGAGAVTVAPVPRIGLLLTGDELRKAGDPLGDGGIWDINTPMLRAALAEAGCTIGRLESICRYHVSPGGTTETTAVFVGEAALDGVGGVHGNPDENEDIQVHIVDATEAIAMADDGRIANAMGLIGLNWFARNHERLRSEWRAGTPSGPL